MRSAVELHTRETQRGAQGKEHPYDKDGRALSRTQGKGRDKRMKRKNGRHDVRGRQNVPIWRWSIGGGDPPNHLDTASRGVGPLWLTPSCNSSAARRIVVGEEEGGEGDPSDQSVRASTVGRNPLSGPSGKSSAARSGGLGSRGHVYPVFKGWGGG